MPRSSSVSNDHGRWPELADAIQAARVGHGYIKRAAFARHLDINDSTLQIVEGNKRGSVSEAMLDRITQALGWQRGEWRRVLEEGAEPSTDPIRAAPDSLLLGELLRRANEREQSRAAG